MASSLDNDQFNTLVGLIPAAASEEGKRAAVAAAVTYLAETDTLRVWAQKLSNTLGYRDRAGREDVPGVIAERMMKSLTAVTAGQLRSVNNWASFLYGHAENAVKDYLVSSQVTPASGMSGAYRRQTTISIAHRNLLAELGREPTKAEVIAAANQHVAATRKDPSRQGALIRESDFHVVAGPAASVDAFMETGFDIPSAPLPLEEKVEAALAVRRLKDWCAKEHPTDRHLPDVLMVWLRLHVEGERVSVIRIANETGFSRAATKQAMGNLEQVLELMREFN